MDALTKFRKQPLKFIEVLRLVVAGVLVGFGTVMRDWQRADFESILPGALVAAGIQKPGQAKQRVWLERPRGHSKTFDLAAIALVMLVLAPNHLRGIVCAADRDQAAQVRNAIETLCRNNAWLEQVIQVDRFKVTNVVTGSVLEIISSDAKSSYGLTLDFAICDEITHWANGELWESVLSTIAKKPNAMLLVICNAGYRDHWSWPVRESVRTNDRWHFAALDGPDLTLISQELIDEQAELLPLKTFNRLILNQWQSTSGDAFRPSDIDAAITLTAKPVESGVPIVAGLDVGIKADRTGLVTVAKVGERFQVVDCQSWKPGPNDDVDLEEVFRAIIALHEKFGLSSVACDPWQAIHLIQQLRKRGLKVIEQTFGSTGQQSMAATMLGVVRQHLLDIPVEYAELIADVRSLSIVESGGRFRLFAPRSEQGHADCAFGLAAALVAAKDAKPVSTVREWGGFVTDVPSPIRTSRALSGSGPLYRASRLPGE